MNTFRTEAELESVARWASTLAYSMFFTSVVALLSLFVEGVEVDASARIAAAAFEIAVGGVVLQFSRAVRTLFDTEVITSAQLMSFFRKLRLYVILQVLPLFVTLLFAIVTVVGIFLSFFV